MAYVDFLSPLHRSTPRDYIGRVTEFPKAIAAKIAKQFGRDYWDGKRHFGYGGYQYDGRWRQVAEAMRDHYHLASGDAILDVGCGKGFLLYELAQLVPGISVAGIDISRYAIEKGKEEVRSRLIASVASRLPFRDQSFDLVFSINTLHNLRCCELESALKEIERVGRKHKYLTVESFRTEEEKVNLLYWQLTCQSFYSPDDWTWWFNRCGYTGDHSFIFFE